MAVDADFFEIDTEAKGGAAKKEAASQPAKEAPKKEDKPAE